MKILQGTGAARPTVAPDPGRLDALENIVKSILQRLQALEEHQESAQQTVTEAPPSLSAAALDTEAVKKGLLTKMWKYLNDERPQKAA